jgi:hypothetical protein
MGVVAVLRARLDLLFINFGYRFGGDVVHQFWELLEPGLRHHTSIYADDIVAFLRPSAGDFLVFTAIIDDFVLASGLHTNLDKCSVHLIRALRRRKLWRFRSSGSRCMLSRFIASGCLSASGSRPRRSFSTRLIVWPTAYRLGGHPYLITAGLLELRSSMPSPGKVEKRCIIEGTPRQCPPYGA